MNSAQKQIAALTAEREKLREQIKELTAQLSKMREDRDAEEDKRLNLEEVIANDVAEANRAIGYAALRMLALVERVNPS